MAPSSKSPRAPPPDRISATVIGQPPHARFASVFLRDSGWTVGRTSYAAVGTFSLQLPLSGVRAAVTMREARTGRDAGAGGQSDRGRRPGRAAADLHQLPAWAVDPVRPPAV